MRNSFIRNAFNLVAFAFIIIVIGKYVIVAQNPITGDWKADARPERQEKDGKIHISFERRTENGHNQNGSSYSFDELRGLSREQTQNGRVSFSIAREAGTVECEGTFTNGKGLGTFRFVPNQSFFSGMKSRGFDFERSERKHEDGFESRILSAALLNITTALADDLLSANFGKLDVDDLFKAAIFKVDSKFMIEMKNSGFPNLNFEDLVKARIFKINADFVRKVNDMGFGTKDFEQVVKYSIHKVTPEYLAELKAAGFDNLTAEEVIKFRIFKVTPELLTDLKSEGFSKLSAEEIVKFRIFNIDKEFIRKAKAEDPNVTVEEIVKMKIGVHRVKKTI